MITGALHHLLIEQGVRKEVTIIVKGGDIWETHHFASLLSFGADYIYPYLALSTATDLAEQADLSNREAQSNYVGAVKKGLLKIMSKLGISTLTSYKGAQTFEALGIHKEVIDLFFKGTVSRIGGMTFDQLQKENAVKHDLAFQRPIDHLPDAGNFQWKRRGEMAVYKDL